MLGAWVAEHGISEEFKVRAVEFLEEARYNARFESQAVKTVASSLGIAQETLRRWSKSQDGLAVPFLSARQAQDEVKGCVDRIESWSVRMRFCRRRQLFSPPGLTRTGVKNTVYRRVRVTVWYRAYLHSIICESSWWVYHCPCLLSSEEA